MAGARIFLLGLVLPLVLILVVSQVVGGAGLAFSGAIGVAGGGVIIGGLALIALPGWILLRFYVILSIILAGLVEYYGRVTGAMWLPSLVGLSLLLWVLPRQSSGIPLVQPPPYIWLFYGMLLFWIGISLIQLTNPIIFLLAAVNFLMVFFSFPGVVRILREDPRRYILWLEKAIASLPFVQLPFILHQRLFLGGAGSWDHVVGTFGGYIGRTGRNADMMMFMVAATGFALHLYQSGIISSRRWWLTFCTVFLIIGLGENKAFFLFLPILLLVQQWPRIRREPHKAILFGMVLFGFLTALWTAYSTFNYGARYAGQADMSAMEMIDKSLGVILDPQNVDYEDGELGRMAALNIWSSHVSQDNLAAWVGYGLGASRLSAFGPGVIALAYLPLKLTSTAMAQLLWDVGILGVLLYAVMLFSSVRYALNRSKHASSIYLASRYRTIGAALTMFLITLPYKNSMSESTTVKVLIVFLLAMLWVTRSQEVAERDEVSSRRIEGSS